jgi:putative restriction endonuclease
MEKEFTNRALIACLRDQVPVGVMRQTRAKPHVRYHVLGVALVVDWKDGYFVLEGVGPDGAARRATGAIRTGMAASSEARSAFATGAFDPSDEKDARQRMLAAIVRRQGQPAFRPSWSKRITADAPSPGAMLLLCWKQRT